MLHEPARHEALTDTAWDDGRVHEVVRTIAARLLREREAHGQWPVHPLDRDDGPLPPRGYHGLYLGAAGVLWALWTLQRAGFVDTGIDAAAAIDRVAQAYRAEPDDGQVVPSYLMGEAGIALVQWRLGGDAAAAADRVHAAARANIDHPSKEMLWGAPGTMIAAWHLWRASGEARWRRVYVDSADALWQQWRFDEAAGCHLWTQDLYGKTAQYIGAGHGLAGNVHPLLLGADLLDQGQREALVERSVHALQRLARHEGDAANWPPGTWTPRPGSARMLMQWCHGAPGIVTAFAPCPPGRSPALDTLLLAAGRAIWQAGPLAKGPGLCHGTAGNGYALLALHSRSGDAIWLERARRFAMHAIEQHERALATHGHGRPTLWTGDAGLAIYLADCLLGRDAGWPTLDWI